MSDDNGSGLHLARVPMTMDMRPEWVRGLREWHNRTTPFGSFGCSAVALAAMRARTATLTLRSR